MPVYDEYVDYFEEGVVAKNFIRLDKERYCQRWREVQNTLDGEVSIQNTQEPDTKLLTFYIKFYVRSPERRDSVSGTAKNTLKVRKMKDQLKIIDEKQKVLARRRIS